MDVDSDNNELLNRVAQGDAVEQDRWPGLLTYIIVRLNSNARNEFPIPNLPPHPPTPPTSEPRASQQSSPAEPSEEANKENAPAETQPETQSPGLRELPRQIADMLVAIVSHLETFTTFPPHTIQRLAELILQPRGHYKALAAYLHAVDRVVQVTSGTNVYPLPPAIPDMSSMHLNGDDSKDPASTVAWSNPTAAALGTDEALGGALLTPIPWLTRRSPESGQDTPGAQIHSESTETIDGPNGMGSIETVSVSVNGVPSTGHRGVTQGELLRQEQKAGVVPVSQLSRAQDSLAEDEPGVVNEGAEEPHNEEEEVPHARGPEEIGVGDTGPQAATTSFATEGGLEMQNIDVEAAVGRKHEDDEAQAQADGESETENEAKSPGAESVGTKRDAEQELEGEPVKKVKEDSEDSSEKHKAETQAATGEVENKATPPAEDAQPEKEGDKMETE